jgi:subtilisin family serine protease
VFFVFSESIVQAEQEFSFKIQPLLKRDPMTIPAKNQRTLYVGAIMVPPKWKTFQYVENDVILKPGSRDLLNKFLNRWNAQLVSDGAIPAPPQELSSSIRPIPATNGWYRARVNVDSADIDFPGLYSKAKAQGYVGLHVFSSWKMLALFSVVLESRSTGHGPVEMNSVMFSGSCPRTSSQEYAPWRPDPDDLNGGYYDAYGAPCFVDPEIQVTEAWKVMDLFGRGPHSATLAVIDRGFMMNDDFPNYTDYDFIDEDDDANFAEEEYHGTKCVSMAAARMDNRFGFAGTGAPVTYPLIFRHDGSFFQMEWAVRTAVAWGAQVVNISSSGQSQYHYNEVEALDEALDLAFDSGVAVVVSAGNDGEDIGGNDLIDWPAECGSDGKRPIVVGAIDLGSKRAVRTEDGYEWGSNFGSPLTLWAPGGPELSILTTPTPTDPDISYFEGTSCAAPYAAGVVAMMKALNPGLGPDEIKNILAATSRISPDGRVSQGYLKALDAVLSAAGGAIPEYDEHEPSDFTHFTRLSGSGSVCGSLFPGDDEDGYMFYLNDFTHVELSNSESFGYNGYDATLRGAGIHSPVSPPFTGTLSPGGYYLYFSRRPEGEAFYQLNYELTTLVDMEPDRFETNDRISDCAAIEYPEDRIGEVWDVGDLNFHQTEDADFFALSLPELPGPEYDEALTLYAEPGELGTYHLAQFYLSLYDAAARSTNYGSALTLENLAGVVSDSRVIRFRVESNHRRNYYRLQIGYDQWLRGVETPSTVSFFEIPEWMKVESQMHAMLFPPSYADGLPIPFSYPSDPGIVDAFMQGNPPSTIPTERIVLKWAQKADLGVDFIFRGNTDELSFKLIDAKGGVLAEGMSANLKKAAADQNNSIDVRNRIEYPSLPRGIYGIDVQGTRFAVPFTAVFDSIKTTPVESVKNRPIQSTVRSFDLSQNYPNPFNSSTLIRFSVADPCRVVLKVFDIQGREWVTLMDAKYSRGSQSVKFNATGLPSGIYMYTIRMKDFTASRKMVVVE